MALCGTNKRDKSAGDVAQPAQPAQPSLNAESYNFGNTLKFQTFGDNQTKKLVKGVYEIDAYVDAGNDEAVAVDDFTENIDYLGDIKQVRYKRVTLSRPKDVNGQMLSRLRAVVSIDENPIPIAIILWGALGATGLGAGGYFINSVNRFTESSFNQVLAILSIGVTAYFALRK